MTAIILLSGLTGCGKDVQETDSKSAAVELAVDTTFGSNDGNRKNWEDSYHAWEQATGNHIRDGSGIPDEAWKAQVRMDFESGAEPDVLFFFNGADANSFVKAGKVVDLATIREDYPDFASNMKEETLSACASPVDGKVYAIPTYGYWEALYVNKTVLEQAGVEMPGPAYTWEQFLADCQTIRDQGFTPIAASLRNIPNYWFEYCVYNYTSPSIHTALPASSTDELGTMWLSGLADLKLLYEKGFFPEDTNSADETDTYQLFLEDQAAFMLEGSWRAGDIASSYANGLENIGLAYPPSRGGQRKTTDLIGGLSSGYYITKKAYDDPVKREAAVDFVKYMTSDATIAEFAAQAPGAVTALKTPLPAAENANPLEKEIVHMLRDVTAVTGAAQDLLADDVRKGLFDQIKFIVTGDQDPAAVIDRALTDQKIATGS